MKFHGKEFKTKRDAHLHHVNDVAQQYLAEVEMSLYGNTFDDIAAGEVTIDDLVRQFEKSLWEELGHDVEVEQVPEEVKSVMTEVLECDGLPMVSGKLRGRPVTFLCLIYDDDGNRIHGPDDVKGNTNIHPIAVLHPLECTEYDDATGPDNDKLEEHNTKRRNR